MLFISLWENESRISITVFSNIADVPNPLFVLFLKERSALSHIKSVLLRSAQIMILHWLWYGTWELFLFIWDRLGHLQSLFYRNDRNNDSLKTAIRRLASCVTKRTNAIDNVFWVKYETVYPSIGFLFNFKNQWVFVAPPWEKMSLYWINLLNKVCWCFLVSNDRNNN